jgi:hypothetical protein
VVSMNKMQFLICHAFLCFVLSIAWAAASGQQISSEVSNADLRAGIHELDVAPVWSGHPVGFSLLTHDNQQYVAYYAADRKMTVAQRTLGQREWHYTVLPTTVGWDSHNYITMAFDRDEYLHLSGNMHVTPLVYFRSARPRDASSLVRVPAMTGKDESQTTYPVFSHSSDGTLLFHYRSGRSGAGDTYWNRYDEHAKIWKALTDEPLFQGGLARNAYPLEPVFGPDGWYHQVWVWRDSSMADSNHDISYARSRDLVHWESANGTSLKLPLTVTTPDVVVDPVPIGGGAIDGAQSVVFDVKGHLVLPTPNMIRTARVSSTSLVGSWERGTSDRRATGPIGGTFMAEGVFLWRSCLDRSRSGMARRV